MRFNLNDAEQQTIYKPVPAGIYKLLIKLKSNALTLAKNLRTQHAEFEFEIVTGDYAGRKIFDLITLLFNDEDDPTGLIPPITPEQAKKFRTAVRLGRAKLKALVDSAFEFDPFDKSEVPTRVRDGDALAEIDGRWCWASVGVRRETADYKARNDIEFFYTKDMSDWPGPLGNAGAPSPSPRGSSTLPAPTLREEMDDSIPF